MVNSCEPQNLTVKAEPGTATQLLPAGADHHLQAETIQVLRCNYCTLTFHDTPEAKRALMEHVTEVHGVPAAVIGEQPPIHTHLPTGETLKLTIIAIQQSVCELMDFLFRQYL